MKHARLGPAERPSGYEEANATIESEKQHALAAFRGSSFDRRILERIGRPRSRRVVRSRLALVGALFILVFGIGLFIRTTRRIEGVGLRAAAVERALRNTPFFAGRQAPDAPAETDPRRAELFWSIQRIIASVQRARVRERDFHGLLEQAITGAVAVVPAAADPWQNASAARLGERIERLRRERSIERLLTAYYGIG
jgi:hypothetical protein